jgi:hypothetical protein
MSVQPNYRHEVAIDEADSEIDSYEHIPSLIMPLTLPLRKIHPAPRPGMKHSEVRYDSRGIANRSTESVYHEVLFYVDESGRESNAHIIDHEPWEYSESAGSPRLREPIHLESLFSEEVELDISPEDPELVERTRTVLFGFSIKTIQ